MNSKFQKIMVAIIAILVFVVTFFGSSKEQVIVETKKIVSDSNNINNKYLVGVEWLNENIHNANLVILDIRSKKQYDEGHIPGAINVSWNQFISNSSNNNGNENNTNNENSNNQNSDNETSNSQNVNTQSNSDNQNNTNSSNNSTTENNENSNGESTNNSTSVNNEGNTTKNWTALLNKKKLSEELQDLGITQKSIVVIYGDSNSQNLDDLGKFSWMFRMVGIDSKMLNGGYDNWKAEGFESIKGVPLPKKSNIEIENFVTNKAITLDEIKKNISKLKIVQLVNDIKPKNINTNNSQTNGNSNSSNVNGQNQVNNSSLNNQEVNSNVESTSNSSNSGNNSNSSTNTSNGTNQAYITESNLPPAGVTQIKLSELLNSNGTIKSVNRLDNLFNNKGINQNDIILFYNSDKGNIAFMSLILKMAGFDNIKYYNANLTQVAAIRNAIINQQNNPNSNSGSNSNSGNSANTNNDSNSNSSNSNNSTATSNNSTNSSANNNSNNSSNNN
ncbi:sulfurtransferase [Clostridium mediterraneense]|uniref:sulfurtransferase n=1 Tax=Clostridium mediterraneense TaxID=1805472 RepID=UPI00082A1E8F|nr:rhodanese-like domain-containing protein [Clostridium mediterraneense]